MFALLSKLISLLITQHFSRQSPSLWRMLLSVFAAIFGVQSEQNRERDFSNGSPWVFVLLGLIALIVFIVAVILLTRWALSLAGV